MQNDVILDISENAISHLNVSLLEILLFDRTTRKNILWATDDYAERGVFYAAGDEIKPDLITGANGKIIQPRVLKAREQKLDRTRVRAEVFTPSWVCNQQNNLIDEQWFDGKQVFNVTEGTTWSVVDERIPFPENGMKTWKKYVDAKRIPDRSRVCLSIRQAAFLACYPSFPCCFSPAQPHYALEKPL